MRRLGISIYPEKSSDEELFKYIDLAHEAGCSRIFSCLLSVKESREHIKERFSKINAYAKEKGFKIIVDVSPRVFNDLGISYQDLSFFKEIGADGVRLDAGFTGSEESLMTFNPHGLDIEINMSNDTRYIDTIMNYQPNPYHLLGCHNFYPHQYSGLSLEHFLKCTANFKKHGIRSAAFVCSQTPGSFGPWVVTQGLPTLEMHRHLPLHIQMKHMIALGVIDDIIISNCFPSVEEWKKVASVNHEMLNLSVKLVDNIPEIEKKIVLEELHFDRGDKSEYLIRSSQSRVKYRGHEFTLFNAPEMIKRGDIIIESSTYGHYAGEMMIALKDMVNSGKSNVVGHIVEEELFLLDYIKPWQKFRLSED